MTYATTQTRKRAPSERSLETQGRIFDAAESVFALQGFEGATLREIAKKAGTQVSLVHHHGGSKDALFFKVVERRSEELSQARLQALEDAKNGKKATLEGLLTAFFNPFWERTQSSEEWRNYARLVAYVSTDDRWHEISAACFDPTAQVFLAEFEHVLPKSSRHSLATSFVFAVSAMLALFTSKGRIVTLADQSSKDQDQLASLVTYCAAGMRATA